MMPEPSRRAMLAAVAGAAPLAVVDAVAQGSAPTHIGRCPSVADWGVRGNNDPNDGERIQRALDEAPLGGDLFFPPGDFRIQQTLRVRRHLNLIAAGARLNATFAPASIQPLLEVNVEDAVNRDSRLQRLQGLRLSMVSGLGDAIVVRNRAPNIANIGLIIEGNLIAGPSTGPGHALRLEGIGTHHLSIRNNQIINGVYLANADGVTIEECLIFGEKTGVTVDLIPGSFQTRILRNGIVARDGALRVLNGSQVYFEYNQVEQFAGYGANRSPEAAHVAIVPQVYGARHVRLRSNNFGGGDNVRLAVHVSGDCQDLMIDDNVFNNSSTGLDIGLNKGVGWTRIGPNNSVRQQGVGQRPSPNAGMLQVNDEGMGTFGVARPGLALDPKAGWRPNADFRFWKELDGTVRFEGVWTSAVVATGTRIGTLPIGFRPRLSMRLMLPTLAGELALLEGRPDGALIALRTFGGSVDWSGVSFAAASRPDYPTSDP